jgi:RNA polymerase sigma factor (sigma-70 family)
MSNTSYEDVYYNELPAPLPKDKQQELAKQYVEQGDEEAGKELVRTNLRYVVRMASDYSRSDVNYNDLVQAGNLGLQKALDKFDPDVGCPFTAYAFYWIRNEMLAQIKHEETSFRISSNAGNHIYQNIRRAKRELAEEGFEVNAQNIAEKLDEDVEEVQRLISSLNTCSLDQNYTHEKDDSSFKESIEADQKTPFEQIEESRFQEEVDSIFARFKDECISSERELDILENRILTTKEEQETYLSISNRWDVSQARIYQVADRLEDTLKEWIVHNVDGEALFDLK